MFFLVVLPPCLGVTFMLLLVVLQWFCLLPRDNCQFLVVLLPALGFSITVRDPEPSEKHFKKIINYIFRVMQNVFSPPARSKTTLCRFVIVYGQCIFSGDIFFACAVYTNVLRTELSVSFLSILWLQAVFLWSS